MWKTVWKMFNSTEKTGFEPKLLNGFHGVFHLWKKQGPFTKCISGFCGKLFLSAKWQEQSTAGWRKTAGPPERSPGTEESLRKFCGRTDKKRLLAGNAGRLMLYFILDHQQQNSSASARRGPLREAFGKAEGRLPIETKGERYNGRKESAAPSAP